MITNLKIVNFRDVHNVEYDRLGLINEITGSNGVGKTTILDCILWLLCDETLIFKTNNDKNINRLNPNEIIDCELTINDNVIRRKYGNQLNDDNTITPINAYYVNDRRVKTKNEYISSIYNFVCFKPHAINIISPLKLNILRLLINPTELLEGLEEKKFRTLIEKFLNIDTTSILLEDEKYQSLRELFERQGNDINNVKDFLNQKIDRIDKEIVGINAQINLYKDFKYDEEKHSLLLKELEELKNQKFEDNKEIEVLLKRKEQVFNELNNSIIEDNKKEENIDLKLLENKGKELKSEVLRLEKVIETLTDVEIYNLKRDNERLETVIKNNKEKIERIKKKELKETRCPNCNFLINKEHKENFELEKEQEIKLCEKEISTFEFNLKTNNNILELKFHHLEELKKELDTKNVILDETRTKYRDIVEEEKKKELNSNKTSEKTINLKKEFEDLEVKIRELSRENTENRLLFNTSLLEKQSELNTQILDIERIKSGVTVYNTCISRKKEILMDKQDFETKQILLKQFVDDEINLLNSYTKEIFGDEIEFVMLEKAKTSDSTHKVCYPKYNGKDYDSWNTATRLLLAIKIVEAFKKYLGGVDLPIIFDVADNIGNSIIEEIYNTTKSQMFFTTVKREDDQPRELIIRKENV